MKESFGNPAILDVFALRSVILRPHISMSLPLSRYFTNYIPMTILPYVEKYENT